MSKKIKFEEIKEKSEENFLCFFFFQLELTKLEKQRLERERQREAMEKEKEFLQRIKEAEYYREWEKQEDSVRKNDHRNEITTSFRLFILF